MSQYKERGGTWAVLSGYVRKANAQISHILPDETAHHDKKLSEMEMTYGREAGRYFCLYLLEIAR